ncbi:MAG: type II toxin-antitoxin system VapC family toxin [Gammaproteobacteria bacterium]
MIVVLDASVIVKWFFPDPAEEPHSKQALTALEAVRDGNLEPLQPPHWLAEVAAVITRLERDQAAQAIDLLDAMELPVAGETAIYKHAVEIAGRLDQHLFDTLYHAVAMEHDVTLLTADRRYYRKCRQLGHITYLADWVLGSEK